MEITGTRIKGRSCRTFLTGEKGFLFEMLSTCDFCRADKDKNNRLDSKELAEWIRRKIVEHISSAVNNNYGLFTIIDVSPKNGVITWKEYHTYFLKKRGFSNNYVNKHDEKRHKGLQRSVKGRILIESFLLLSTFLIVQNKS